MANHRCNICQGEFQEFKLYGVPLRPGECPLCGGKPRHRVIFDFIRRLSPLPEILEVGPSAVTTRYLPQQETMKSSRYTVIDIRALKHHQNLKTPHRALAMNATRMSFPDESFDLVMANSVLNWIPDYPLALKEFRRVLRPNGVAVVNAFRIREKTSVKPREYRKHHPEITDEYIEMNGTEWFFGENYLDELRDAGFSPALLNYNAKISEAERKQLGLKDYAEMVVAATDRKSLDAVLRKLVDRAEVISA